MEIPMNYFIHNSKKVSLLSFTLYIISKSLRRLGKKSSHTHTEINQPACRDALCFP